MMKKFFVLCLLLVSCVISSAETLVSHWDFNKGITSVINNYKMLLRGETSIQSDANGKFLKIGEDGTKNQGLASDVTYPSLAPKAFRAEIKFRITCNPKAAWCFLLDCKYFPNETSTPKLNRGFMLYLDWKKQSQMYVPTAAIGLGTRSLFLTGVPVKLEMNRIYTMTLAYNGYDSAEIKLDDAINQAFTGLEGDLTASAYYNFCIGDRYGAKNYPFNGDIFDVKLYSLQVGAPLSQQK